MRYFPGIPILCALAAPLAAQAPAPRIDPHWLTIDAEAHRATFELDAGLTPRNGGLNFNGFKSGELTLIIPKGWEVVVDFTNRDPRLPHSVELIGAGVPLPVQSIPPAVSGAAGSHLDDGLPTGAKESLHFTAPPGRYRLFCAVTGHGMTGMWIGLTVSDTAGRPALRAGP